MNNPLGVNLYVALSMLKLVVLCAVRVAKTKAVFFFVVLLFLAHAMCETCRTCTKCKFSLIMVTIVYCQYTTIPGPSCSKGG